MGNFLTTASILMCPHGGMVSAVSSNTKALAGGAPILRASDVFTVSGCAATPNPCVLVQWIPPARKAGVGGDGALTDGDTGMCMSGMGPQGNVVVSSTQSKLGGS